MNALTSMFVQRNLSKAQFAKPQGSKFEGNQPSITPTYLVKLALEDWDEPCCSLPADHQGTCIPQGATANKRGEL